MNRLGSTHLYLLCAAGGGDPSGLFLSACHAAVSYSSALSVPALWAPASVSVFFLFLYILFCSTIIICAYYCTFCCSLLLFVLVLGCCCKGGLLTVWGTWRCCCTVCPWACLTSPFWLPSCWIDRRCVPWACLHRPMLVF